MEVSGLLNVDVPGAASPDPGMPFFKGAPALKQYLIGRLVRFVAFRDFELPGECLYARDLWERHARLNNPMWRSSSRFYLDLMDNVTALAETEKIIYRKDGLSVVHLR